MTRRSKSLTDGEVHGPVQRDPAIAASMIDARLPVPAAATVSWVREVARLAVQARLAGNIGGAVAAHRLLADVLGSMRGGYAVRHDDEPLDEAEAEAVILEAADLIRAS